MEFHLTGLAIGDPLTFRVLATVAVDARFFFGQLRLRLDVDAPAGKPGGETGVLTFFSNGEAELIVGHDDFGNARLFVDTNLGHLCRRQGFGHEISLILTEGNNVDLLAAQLSDHHAHTSAASTYAGTDRVDIVVIGVNRNLCTVTWFPGAGLDNFIIAAATECTTTEDIAAYAKALAKVLK